ncbi:bacillithiol biosynthesis cysteine-adding enzyme BshC [Aquirufa regiilacus]|uniref:Putative cysteine ligase BshC n=1 Tax=Aquirufa regiilacus TaxID=3024868 RepID=A0ABU3TS98_9BACT|nr:bacillithiol biosynthesis cysteine-adding enzyme BshC [Aquirufa sp. LEOWEIH-7C]MDU0808728.1 bacillithiol biosynthesis cysteine-adding enzyme BshC [Aquirufa sp. LEOWEIH-7C]
MQTKTYPLDQINGFGKLLKNYLAGDQALKPLYGNAPNITSFQAQIDSKKSVNRTLLVEVLQDQYQGFDDAPQIASLAEPNTFTVTTGHQLNLFTGPLYVIFKIVSTINLARQLKKAYPAYHFVPVYWMASEDHDWDEINHFHLFGKKIQWDTDQKGPVGRFDIAGLSSIWAELPSDIPVFKECYAGAKNLSAAVRSYMHTLFGQEGLVCLDADDARLKRSFIPVMQADLLENKHLACVNASNDILTNLGYSPQIYAREINFFYMLDGVRERIEKQGDVYKVLNQAIRFSEEELKAEIVAHPERFSPNVAIRPIYQETILPNLAYLGGAAEVAYWFQLKGIFDLHQVPFPILLPRNFGVMIPPLEAAKLEKLELSIPDIFQDERVLRQQFVDKNTKHALDLGNEQERLSTLMSKIAQKAQAIDETLEASVLAEETRWQKGLERLTKKMRKAEERNQAVGLGQIQAIKQKLFPDGNWQERHTNFLEFLLNYPTLLADLLAELDPLTFELFVMYLPEKDA